METQHGSISLWSPLDKTFMDVRIVHPNARSHRNTPLAKLLANNERAKKRQYNSRVINVQKSTFTPLVFSTMGAMGVECRTTIKRAATLIADKRQEKYADVMGYLVTKVRIALLKSILLSVVTSRGTGKPLSSVAFNLVPGAGEDGWS